jgi:hypothetical protein
MQFDDRHIRTGAGHGAKLAGARRADDGIAGLEIVDRRTTVPETCNTVPCSTAVVRAMAASSRFFLSAASAY